MVGIMAENWGQAAANFLNTVKGPPETPSKLRVEQLLRLKEVLLRRDTSLLPKFAPLLAELQTGQPSPVRRLLAELIGEIGLRHNELLPNIVPTLTLLLKDEAPPVARQAITSGTYLFRSTLEKVAIEGLRVAELDGSLKASWTSMLHFKDAVFSIAFQPGIDGVRLLAIKFVETLILLYTPDPNGLSSPPQEAGNCTGFNISWLRGGHPVLKVADLSAIASHSLGLLLDQLRGLQVKSLSNSIVIVLINSLSVIAKKRPSYYGRVLPVLLSLDPTSSIIRGVEISGAFHALKNALVNFLQCSHPGAGPWRARVVDALKDMDTGKFREQALLQSGDSIVAKSMVIKEEKLPLDNSEASGSYGRKRIKIEKEVDLIKEDDTPTKRARISTKMPQETVAEPLYGNSDNVDDGSPSGDAMAGPGDGYSGPVHQLVGVFGALVAQGDKASDSLDILISNISSDLLAEVVMVNLRHLPPCCPKIESGDDSDFDVAPLPGLHRKDQPFIASTSFVSDILLLSKTLVSLLNVQHRMCDDVSMLHSEENRTDMHVDSTATSSTFNNAIKATSSLSIPDPENIAQAESGGPILSYANDVTSIEGDIPGLDTDNKSGVVQEFEGGSLRQVISSGSILQDTTSSGSALPDTEEMASISNYIVSSSQFFLPKMTAPVIDLNDEQKDQLQKVALTRIIQAHKQISLAGGSNLFYLLLPCLGVESPSELNSWGLLLEHISSDYINNEGQELSLRILFRLFRESEQDQDFFSSTTATSDYEKFLLGVAETLRDVFPATDKSLSKLLVEAPYLPKSVLSLLECLCCPDGKDKVDQDVQIGERVHQGLSAVWNLISQRPSNRAACLNIALKSAVHPLEEVRMKAIRLVANKLFPMPSITQKIEDFAGEMLLSVEEIYPSSESTCAGELSSGPQKDDVTEKTEPANTAKDMSLDSASTVALSSSVFEAKRRMSLYFALCTKKHSLLHQIFATYENMPKAAKQAVDDHLPILVRTTGASPELLKIISDPPGGSQALLVQVLHTLTDRFVPSQELVNTVKKLFDTKLKDVEILIPILSSLSKDEVSSVFPQIVNLSADKFQAALCRITKGSPHTNPVLSPEEVLIAIHEVDPAKDGVHLKKVMDACTSCFEQRQVFTQQIFAKALNQLVLHIPLPLLFMRTVIQAIGTFPGLVDFVMEILAKLVKKQIWKHPKLWVGFLKCAVQTKPQSYSVLLQLPAAQLENALNRNPSLKAPVIEYASQAEVQSTLPRPTLVVLGLAQDQQISEAAQTSQSQVAETSNSAPAATDDAEPTQSSTAGS